MKDRRLFWILALGTVATTGCGWVDSSGRQENRSPGLSELTKLVVENRESTKLGLLDEDKNLDRYNFALTSEGSELAEACIAAGGAFANIAAEDFAESLQAACDPLVEQSCEILLEVELLSNQLYLSNVPVLRRPVAQQYQLTLQDTDGASTEQQLTLCIGTESTAPIAVSDNVEVQHDEVQQFPGMEFDANCGPSVASGVLINDSDDFDYSEDDANQQRCLVAELLTPPANHQGLFELNLDGGFSYGSGTTLEIGETDSFTYIVSDGLNQSDPATVLITITGINLPPEALDPESEIDEDSQLVLNAADLADDPEDGSLQLISVGVDVEPTMGLLSFDSVPAEIRYTPNENAFGSDSFSYRIADAAGSDVTGIVSVTVLPVNDSPVVTAEQGQTVSLVDANSTESLLFTVSDVEDDAEGAGLSVSASSDDVSVVTVTASQELDPITEGNWIVDFAAVADGTTTVTITATDSDTESGISEVTVTVGSGNQAPVVQSPSPGLQATEGDDLVIHIIDDGLAEDPDGDDAELIITAVGAEVGGSVVFAPLSQTLTFTPGSEGTASFELTVTDEDGADASATVVVEIAAATQAPVLATTVLNSVSGQREAWGISADSLASDADTDATDLEFFGTPTSADGVVGLDPSNKIINFTASSVGVATINVTIVDPQGNSVTGELTINVSAAPAQSPVLTTTGLTATNGEQKTWSISADGLATDADSDVADLEFSGTPTSSGGAVLVDGTNKQLSFTPSAVGVTTIEVTIVDLDGNSVSGDLDVTVAAAANVAPTVAATSLNVIHGIASEFELVTDVPVTDSDGDADDVVVDSFANESGVTVEAVVGDNKAFSVTSTGSDDGSFDLTVLDVPGDTGEATITIVVGANQEPTISQSALTQGTAGTDVEISKLDVGVADVDSADSAISFASLSFGSIPLSSNMDSADLSIDGAGAISFTPDVSGDYEIDFELHDEVNTPDFTLTVTIN